MQNILLGKPVQLDGSLALIAISFLPFLEYTAMFVLKYKGAHVIAIHTFVKLYQLGPNGKWIKE